MEEFLQMYQNYKQKRFMGKVLWKILPFAFLILLIVVIFSVIAAVFGSEEAVQSQSFVLPFDSTEYTITSEFGERTDPIKKTNSYHNGIDVVPSGTMNILSIAGGKVVYAGDYGGGGNTVMIEHNIGGTLYKSIYHHLKDNSIIVKEDEPVEQGQQIGVMGSTGRSTGPHLHIGLQKFNIEKQKYEFIDPSIIFESNKRPELPNLFDYDNNRYNNQNNNSDENNEKPSLPKIGPNLPNTTQKGTN